MTTTNTIIGLRNNVARPIQGAAAVKCAQECDWVALPNTALCKYLGLYYIALNEIVENSASEDKGKSGFTIRDVLFDLWRILFPDHGRETYRRLEGDDMTPITAYKSGKHYYVAEGGNSLAAARYLGQPYVLAQVWELP